MYENTLITTRGSNCVVEHLTNIHKVLGSVPCSNKTKQNSGNYQSEDATMKYISLDTYF